MSDWRDSECPAGLGIERYWKVIVWVVLADLVAVAFTLAIVLEEGDSAARHGVVDRDRTSASSQGIDAS